MNQVTPASSSTISYITNLPPEILLKIFKSLPSWSSIRAFSLSSQSLHTFFEAHKLEELEVVFLPLSLAIPTDSTIDEVAFWQALRVTSSLWSERQFSLRDRVRWSKIKDLVYEGKTVTNKHGSKSGLTLGRKEYITALYNQIFIKHGKEISPKQVPSHCFMLKQLLWMRYEAGTLRPYDLVRMQCFVRLEPLKNRAPEI